MADKVAFVTGAARGQGRNHSIRLALFARFSSRQPDSPTMKTAPAVRQQFGGHQVRTLEVQK
ncbi:hypothetical protein ACWEK5_48490 [Rhodococcus koreensis]